MSIVVLLDTADVYGTATVVLAGATAAASGEANGGVGASTLAGAAAAGTGLTPQFLDVDSIDASVAVNGVGSLELITTVGITQYIDVPSIDAGSQPVGGWLFGGT